MYPDFLKAGDKIRIVAPSKSMSIIDQEVVELAIKRLLDLGLEISFGKSVNSVRKYYDSASIEERISDLHEAFADPSIKAVLSVVGGYNSNQLLPYIDYELIKNNPKVFCGLSDITVLQNAFYARAGLVTFSGPHFSNFGMRQGFEYTEKYFKKMLFSSEDSIFIQASELFSSDKWYEIQNNRTFQINEGFLPINPGKAEGRIIGGNLCTFNLLLGTNNRPSLKESILFLEDTNNLRSDYFLEFDRNLEAIIQQADFCGVRGIVIGRAENNSGMTSEKWIIMIREKAPLARIPVMAQVNIGHTTPIFTFPIGGSCSIEVGEKCSIVIKKCEYISSNS